MSNTGMIITALILFGVFFLYIIKKNYKNKNQDDELNNLKNKESSLVEQVSRLENEVVQLKKLYETSNNTVLDLNRITSSLETKSSYLEEQLKNTQNDKEKVESVNDLHNKTIIEISSKNSNLEAQIKSKDELIKSLQDDRGEYKLLSETYNEKNIEINSRNSTLESQLQLKEESLSSVIKDRDAIKLSNEIFQEKISTLSSRASTLEAQLESKEEQLKVLKETFEDVRKQSKDEFMNLANEVLESKTKSFTEQNEKNMDTILNPFKSKLSEFQATVTKYREDEMKEAASLKTEIQYISQLNKQLSEDAINLTNALKGNKKTLGNWGEMILSRVLESSGLREGEEYILQAKELKLTDDDGKRQAPDVVINLPEGKHLVVDSKVTLVSYEKYISSQNDVDRGLFLKKFLESLEDHIKGLSEKKYDLIGKLITPDFVLMFIPIEGAFSTALQNDNKIFEYGWDKRIIIVSPTTLMVTLKTIESIWKQEKQNKNTLEIVRQAGGLYDKFHGFNEDLTKLGKSINLSKTNYDDVMSMLAHGSGNIIGRFEKMKKLGAKTTKQLNIAYDEDN
jgi:DNA recombination protein RmuC